METQDIDICLQTLKHLGPAQAAHGMVFTLMRALHVYSALTTGLHQIIHHLQPAQSSISAGSRQDSLSTHEASVFLDATFNDPREPAALIHRYRFLLYRFITRFDGFLMRFDRTMRW